MARVCSMIRRSARGVRESMRFGMAFYEFRGPLFALESREKSMTLFIAEASVLTKYKDSLPGVDMETASIFFADLNRLPLTEIEAIVRGSVAARRNRLAAGDEPSEEAMLALWKIDTSKE